MKFRNAHHMAMGGLLAAGLMVTSTAQATDEILLMDNFDGTGVVDQSIWGIATPGAGSFLGRTQLQTDAALTPLQGQPSATSNDNNVALIELNTYYPDDPGNAFLGAEINTRANFVNAGGIRWEARARVQGGTAGGLAGGMFLYDVTRDNVGDGTGLVRDEFDFELVTNNQNSVLTQAWNDAPFTGVGSGGNPQTVAPAGYDITTFHDYRIDWTPDQLDYYIDGNLVRTLTGSDVPDDPMKARFNLWAPDSSWPDAYNAALQPAASSGANQTYTLEVDSLKVTRFDTDESANLLVDGDFETQTTVPNITDTGGWWLFGNAFFEDNDGSNGVPTTEGTTGSNSLKAFGPFFEDGSGSGALQNVEVDPGDILELDFSAITSTTAFGFNDSILGKNNFVQGGISFHDANGDIILDVAPPPSNPNGDGLNANDQIFASLDGRNPFMPEDVFVDGRVNAVAPAGTVYARVTLVFVQLFNDQTLGFDGGSAYWDGVSLVKLTEAAPAFLVGDMNLDGNIDGLDIDGFVLALTDLSAYAASVSLSLADATVVGDINLDGSVDGLDIDGFVALLTGPVNAVPEPASISLLCLGSVALIRRRR